MCDVYDESMLYNSMESEGRMHWDGAICMVWVIDNEINGLNGTGTGTGTGSLITTPAIFAFGFSSSLRNYGNQDEK